MGRTETRTDRPHTRINPVKGLRERWESRGIIREQERIVRTTLGIIDRLAPAHPDGEPEYVSATLLHAIRESSDRGSLPPELFQLLGDDSGNEPIWVHFNRDRGKAYPHELLMGLEKGDKMRQVKLGIDPRRARLTGVSVVEGDGEGEGKGFTELDAGDTASIENPTFLPRILSVLADNLNKAQSGHKELLRASRVEYEQEVKQFGGKGAYEAMENAINGITRTYYTSLPRNDLMQIFGGFQIFRDNSPYIGLVTNLPIYEGIMDRIIKYAGATSGKYDRDTEKGQCGTLILRFGSVEIAIMQGDVRDARDRREDFIPDPIDRAFIHLLAGDNGKPPFVHTPVGSTTPNVPVVPLLYKVVS